MDLNYLERSMNKVESLLNTFRNDKLIDDNYIKLLINILIESGYLTLIKNDKIFYLTYDDINPDISDISNDELSWMDSIPNNIEGSIKIINLNIDKDKLEEEELIHFNEVDIIRNCIKEYIFCDKISLIRIMEKILNEGYYTNYSYQDLQELN